HRPGNLLSTARVALKPPHRFPEMKNIRIKGRSEPLAHAARRTDKPQPAHPKPVLPRELGIGGVVRHHGDAPLALLPRIPGCPRASEGAAAITRRALGDQLRGLRGAAAGCSVAFAGLGWTVVVSEEYQFSFLTDTLIGTVCVV